MECKCKVGDAIGYLTQVNLNDDKIVREWYLFKAKITGVSFDENDIIVLSDRFYPLKWKELASNTIQMKENNSIIVTEPFVLTNEIEENVERWLDNVNKITEEEHVLRAV